MSAFRGLTIMQKQKVSRILTACTAEDPGLLAQAGATIQLALRGLDGRQMPVIDKVLPALAMDLNSSAKAAIRNLDDHAQRAVGLHAFRYAIAGGIEEQRNTARICQIVADLAKADHRVVNAAALRMVEIGEEAGVKPRRYGPSSAEAIRSGMVERAVEFTKGQPPQVLMDTGITIAELLDGNPAPDDLGRALDVLARTLRGMDTVQLERLQGNDRPAVKRAFQYACKGDSRERVAIGEIIRVIHFLHDYTGDAEGVSTIGRTLDRAGAAAGAEPREIASRSAETHPVATLDDVSAAELAELRRKAAALDSIIDALEGRNLNSDGTSDLYAIEEIILKEAGIEIVHEHDPDEDIYGHDEEESPIGALLD